MKIRNTKVISVIAISIAIFLAHGIIVYAGGTWAAGGQMANTRNNSPGTILNDGRLFVSGGYASFSPINKSDIYDPSTNTWVATGNLPDSKCEHLQILLPNGKVLEAGGGNNGSTSYATAALYDSGTGTWTATASLSVARKKHTMTLLPNGKVLVTGGKSNSTTALSSCEIFDPATNTWSAAASMNYQRSYHTATLLTKGTNAGKVLVVGGEDGSAVYTNTAELYDYNTNTWTQVASASVARDTHAAVELPNGKVIIIGGMTGSGAYRSDCELYDPATNTWSTTGSMPYQAGSISAVSLANGNILVTGGWTGGTSFTNKASMYNDVTGTWVQMGNLNANRYIPTVVLLNNGKVIVAGGQSGALSYVKTTDLYDTAEVAPTVAAVTAPTGGQTVTTTTFTVSGTALDSDYADELKVYARVDGSNGQAGTQVGSSINANNTNQAYTASISSLGYGNGSHTVYVWVEDDQAGISAETAINITISLPPPALTITASPSGNPSNASNITYTFQFSETVTNFDSSDITVTNGTKGTFTAVDGDTYTLIVNYAADGNQVITVPAGACQNAYLIDNTLTTNTIAMDRTAPVVTGVSEGTIYNVNKTITFNEGTATLDGSGFSSGDTASTEGSHTLDVTDAAGNSTTVHFTIDKTAPVVTGISEGATYNTNKTITFNEGTATLDGSGFSSGSTVSTEGSHTLVVTDAAGNSTTVHFTIDKTAPVVTGVAEGGLYNTSKTITFNEGTATLNGSAFTSGSQAVAEGTHTLVVTDTAGNSTTVHFTIDKTGPLDPVISANPVILTSGSVTITINYAGDASVKVYRIDSGESQAYTAPFTVASNCTIYAGSQDSAGNWSNETSYAVTNIDISGPIIIGVSGGGAYNTNRIILFDKGTATLDGNAFVSGSTVSAEGSYTLVVTYSGNDTTVHFTIDKTDPVITGVSDGGLYNTSKTITFNEGTATLNGSAFTSGSQAVAEGTHVLIVTDSAGNITTVNFIIDKTGPIDPVITANPIIPTSGNVTITITYAIDASAKVYRIDSGESQTYSAPFTVASNCTIYAGSQDAAGNWSNEISYAVNNITTADTTAPTVNVPTATHTTTSITAFADASDPSAPLQYLFNIDGADQGVWQAGSSYTFTGLTINTTYSVKYKAKDSAENISGYSPVLSVITTAGGPVVPTVSKLEVLDIANNDNASDLRVMFKGASSEANIASYKVIVSSGTINEATASALTSASFVSDRTKGAEKIHLIYLTAGLKTSEGGTINAAGGTYNVYVLSVAKVGYSDKLSAPVNITITTNNQGYRIIAPTPVVSDIANNGNGTDLKVTFRKSKSEANVASYRIIVSTTTLTLAQAQSVPAAGYKEITPTNPKVSYTALMGGTQRTQDGVTSIQNGTAYRIYVLAMGKNGYANVLSTPSRIITLSQYVPGTNTIKGLKVVKIGIIGHSSSNISVSFYESLSVSNVQEYRIFIAPSTSTLSQATAEGISDAALYQVVPTIGKGVLHIVVLDAGKKDYTNAAIAAGDYKVYVLTVGKNGYANGLSTASGNVTLN